MFDTLYIILAGVLWVVLGGLIGGYGFRATGRDFRRGLALGALLGPATLLLVIGILIIGSPRRPAQTGTFAPPVAGKTTRQDERGPKSP